MIAWKNYIGTLIFLIALSSEASGQYTFLRRGQASPYDSGVVVRIDRYRAEGLKLKLADRLIDSLKVELFKGYRSNDRKDSLNRSLTFANAVLKDSGERKDKTIDDLNKNFDKAISILQPKGFWNRKEFIFGGGIVLGALGTAGIIKLAK